jgi:alkaline phosphatase D
MQRRVFLHQLHRSAAAMALAALFATPSFLSRAKVLTELQNTDALFRLGLASGCPRPDSVVLWTRLMPQPHVPGGGMPASAVEVLWEIAEDEQFSKLRQEGRVLAVPEHAHSVHVKVKGLGSDRRYFYRFRVGDQLSPVGRTRTAPAAAAPVRQLRFALASCQHYEQGLYAVHREIAEQSLDFVLFVGDYIYESTNSRFRIRSHESFERPTDLDGYRARHATYKMDADLQAAHAAHPWILTWDDHEVSNDYANDRSRDTDNASRFLQLRAAAYKAYFEHMPVDPDRSPMGASMQIHDHWSWGQLAELWTLDARQYRHAQACSEPDGSGSKILGACAELKDPQRSILGMAQEDWLHQGLTQSQRQWKLLGLNSQFSSTTVQTPLGHRIYSDGWDGYPFAQQRLLDVLSRSQMSNVIFMGGDVHRHVASQIRTRANDPDAPIVAAEFICSSVTTRGLSEFLNNIVQTSNPDSIHSRSDERGYALIEITPQATHCIFRSTAFPVVSRLAPLHTQAEFFSFTDRPGVAVR